MSVLDIVRVVVYRFHEKGLEIFLVNSDLENNPDIWKFPKGMLKFEDSHEGNKHVIRLEPVQDEEGREIHAFAIEGDWHDIPSIRGLLKHDVEIVKKTIKEVIPGIDKGAFFAVKEAVKKVMPTEYKYIKELKDILLDRNLVRYI